MKNIFCEAEKRMKSFLKNKQKIKYSKELVIVFLMTGSIFSFSDSNIRIKSEVNSIGKKIIEERSKNRKLLYDSELELERLEKEGDQVIKIPWDSYTLYSGLFYNNVKKKDKEWKYGSRLDTSQDKMRNSLSETNGMTSEKLFKYSRGTTGWITETNTRKNNNEWSISSTSGWSANTATYDNSVLFSIIASIQPKDAPLIQIPNVLIPNVTVPEIQPVNITSSQINPLTVIGQISINTPSVNVGTITQPNVNIISPNIPAIMNISVTAPNLNVSVLNIQEKTFIPLGEISEPQTITAPTVVVNIPSPLVNPNIISPQPKEIVEPNANPFSDFAWGWLSGGAVANTNSSSGAEYALAQNLDVSDGVFWSGVDPDTGEIKNIAGYKNAAHTGTFVSGFNGSRNYDRRHLSIINSYDGRWTSRTVSQQISGGEFHVAGGSVGTTGTEAFHLVADVNLENVTAYLYGKAAFINAEAFRGGRTTMNNVKINVVGDYNSIFHLKGQSPAQDASGYSGGQFSTLFSGNADIKIDTNLNTVYAVRNYAGGLRLKNEGEIIFNGASNIGVSFLTWVPDKSKYIADQFSGYTLGGLKGEGNIESYVPYVELNSLKPMKFYGDENVGIFFNKKISGYDVGIHQGYFKLYFDIGTQLNSDVTATVQSDKGQLNGIGYSAEKVDNSVGVYAISGQRTGVNEDSLSNLAFFDFDLIHNLKMDEFNIRFGKYSNNGFMFLAKNGTVIEIEDQKMTLFSDGINGAATSEADASEGTVIAYAEGTWTTSGTGLTEKVSGNISGKPTEIIVGKELKMISKNGIGFFAKNGGLITVNKNAEGLGYGSIMAYADNGTVTLNAEVKALDAGVTTGSEKNKNRGAIAVNGGTVNINNNMAINGVGAFAEGTGSRIIIGNGKVVTVNNDTALAAFNNGIINVGNGTVINTAAGINSTGSEKIAFYTTGTNSKINFQGTAANPVTINATGAGTLFIGTALDFSSGTKYTGMNNVVIDMKSSQATLGSFQDVGNLNLATFNTSLKNMLGAKEVKGTVYKMTINGGNLSLDRDVNLDSSNDIFNFITSERIVNEVQNGVIVSSTTGKGLAIGSNSLADTAPAYDQSGYKIKGTVDISGGNGLKTGVFTDFGIIDVDSNGEIRVDKGIGAYGVNGSKITNAGVINLTGTPDSGSRNIGITGLALKLDSSSTPVLDTYGSSVISGANAVDIINKGTISVAGDEAIGIFVDNNRSGLNKDKVLVKNLGTINALADKGVGIYANGATVELGTSSNIKVGDNGIGIKTKNSEIKITDNVIFNVGSLGVALSLEGNETITGMTGKTITVNYNTSSLSDVGIGIYYKGDSTASEKFINKAGLKIGFEPSPAPDKKVVGIYALGKSSTQKAKVVNEGIIITGKNDTAIYGKDADIENKAAMAIEEGSTGIAVFNGSVTQDDGTTADQKLTIKKNATGIYAEKSNVYVNESMDVTGESGVGIYASGNATANTVHNNSVITLTDSTSTSDSRIGMYLTNSLGESKNTGIIKTGKNNIGVYNKNSIFKNEALGRIEVLDITASAENIGIYAIAKGTTTDKFSVSNLGILNINGLSNIGIYAEKEAGTGNSEIKLTSGTINIASSSPSGSDYAIGVYSKGDGTTIDGLGIIKQTTGQTIGVYQTGKSLINGNGTIELVSGSTGVYFTNGAQGNSGLLNIENKTAIGAADRPIGLYYNNTVNPGSGVINKISINVKGSSNEVIGIFAEGTGINFENEGSITLGTLGGQNRDSIGIYLKDIENSQNVGTININSKNSFGIYAKGNGSKLINKGTVNVDGESSVGLGIIESGNLESVHKSGTITASGNKTTGIYVEKGKAANESIITATAGGATGSLGVTAVGGEFRNTSTGIINTNNIGIYGENKMNALVTEAVSKLTNEGTININADNGVGVLITGIGGEFVQTGGSIKSAKDSTIGVAITSGAEGNISTGNISSTGLTGKGVYVEGVVTAGVVSSTSKFTFTSGNISTGINGVGIVGKNGGQIILGNGEVTVKDNGVGIYLDKNSSIVSGSLNFNYAPNTVTNKGIGVYYEGDSSSTVSKTNNTSVNILTGTNIINIYSKDMKLTNTAAQTVVKDGIGIYGAVTPLKTGEIFNSGTLTLNGESSIGIYADSGITVKDLSGAMNETVKAKDKVGVYINSGANISGNSVFSFNANGGIGLFLEDYIDYTGTINVDGTTYNDGTDHRTIGVYTNNITSLAKDMKANINVNNIEGVGLYLNNSNVKYNGIINLNASNPSGKNGIGVYVSSGSIVDFHGTLNINGDNNVGYYVGNGGILNLNSGTINVNSQSGIFAYIVDGTITFGGLGTPVIGGTGGISAVVSNSTGEIINRMTLGLGKNGLQAVDRAKITNDTTGILKPVLSNLGMIAMSGSNNSSVVNKGIINLSGGESVGMYVKDSTAFLENGSSILTGEKGTAVFGELTAASSNTIINVGIAATDNTAINLGGEKSVGIYMKKGIGATGNLILNLNGDLDINGLGINAMGLYLSEADTVNGILTGSINLNGDNSKGVYIKDGTLTNQAQIIVGNSTGAENAVGIYAEGNSTVQNNAQVQTGNNSIAFYSNNAIMSTTGNIITGDGGISAISRGINSLFTYNTAGDVYIGNNSSKGFIAENSGTVNLGGKIINVGSNDSVGLIIKNNGIINGISGININSDSTGMYIENLGTTYNINYNISLDGNKARGVLGKNQSIVLNGTVSSGLTNVLGISTVNGGDITNNGFISLTGIESVALYGNNIGTVVNNTGKTITIGDSSVNSAAGIYVDQGAQILNNGDIIIGKGAVGIYGKNISTLIKNSGNITSISDKAIGIYGENSTIENASIITSGAAGVGIYGKNSDITNISHIVIGDSIKTPVSEETSVGIYSSGIGNIKNNINITVGKNAVGIFGEDAFITNDGNITAGESSIYIFSSGTGGNIKNNSTLNLTDKSIGVYTVSGTAENSLLGEINTGKSQVENDPREFSVGMATETGTVINNGKINVSKEFGVGMFAGKKGFDTGRVFNNGTINVTGKNAYGIQVNEGAVAYNGLNGVIDVSGDGAYGISASNKSMIFNDGIINISGGATGIFLDESSYFENNGDMNMVTSGQGVFLATGSTFVNNGNLHVNGISASISDVQLTSGSGFVNVGNLYFDGPNVTLSGVPITNTGNIVINGPLNIPSGENVILDTVNTDNGMGSWKVLGGISGSGNIVLTPGATQGNNKLVQNVQIVDLGTTAGDIKLTSQSVTWLADKWYDSTTGNHVFRLTKIPYRELLANTAAEEFGNGLDQIYEKATGTELKMFDSLDMISNKDVLAEKFDMELRGNIYSNIQSRMIDINNIFESSYRQLKKDENPTKDSAKITLIYNKGEGTDKNPGVIDYDYNSLGVLYLKEKENMVYGKIFNYSMGFAQSKFDFDEDSKEDVSSLNFGIGYEQYLTRNSRFKFITRGELGINYHDTERKIHLDNGTYKNTADYFSGTVGWKNAIKYELPIISKNLKLGLLGTLNLGYGAYEGFKEKGDGIYLDIKSEDYYSLRPGVGFEGEYSINQGTTGKWLFTAGVSYEYETMDMYKDGNKVKIADTTAGYYRLEEPERIDSIFKVGVGAGYELYSGFRIGATVEREMDTTNEMKYQINLSWKF